MPPVETGSCIFFAVIEGLRAPRLSGAAPPHRYDYTALRAQNFAVVTTANGSTISDLSGLIYKALDVMLFPLRMVTVVVLALVLVAIVIIFAISVIIPLLLEGRFLYLAGWFRNLIKFCGLAA